VPWIGLRSPRRATTAITCHMTAVRVAEGVQYKTWRKLYKAEMKDGREWWIEVDGEGRGNSLIWRPISQHRPGGDGRPSRRTLADRVGGSKLEHTSKQIAFNAKKANYTRHLLFLTYPQKFLIPRIPECSSPCSQQPDHAIPSHLWYRSMMSSHLHLGFPVGSFLKPSQIRLCVQVFTPPQ